MDLLLSCPSAPVPPPPVSVHSSTFLSLHEPRAHSAHSPEQRQTRRHCSSCASVLGLCCRSRGLLLKSDIMNWDIISKQPAGRHRSTQCTLGHSGAGFTLLPTNARSDGWCNWTSLCPSSSKVKLVHFQWYMNTTAVWQFCDLIN